MIPIRVWTGALVAVALMALAWWRRERRMRAGQAHQRTLHSLAEDVINAPTPATIAEKLATVLPTMTQATSVNLFLYQRRNRSLERIPTSAEPEPMAASVDSPPEGLANAAVVCFRNRTLLQIPDVRRNPLVKVGPKMSLPRSAMFVPLFSQQEVLGVLELGNSRKTGFFPPEEQADVQHLANQAAAALRLYDRQAMREQLFHSEKLAATGQLISGVASELRTPIENIVNLAASLAAHAADPPSPRDLLSLSSESQRASEIVARLVSFGREDDPPSGALVNISELAAELIRFREPEWKSLGLLAEQRLSNEPAPVMGFRSQIEQALLNLMVHAEHRAAHSPARTLSVQNSVMARKVLIEIAYSNSGDEDPNADPFSSASILEGGSLGLNVCQGIIRSHGGEIRFRSRGASATFEIELPRPPPKPKSPPPRITANRRVRSPSCWSIPTRGRSETSWPCWPRAAIAGFRSRPRKRWIWSSACASTLYSGRCTRPAATGRNPTTRCEPKRPCSSWCPTGGIRSSRAAWNKIATSCCRARFRKESWTAFSPAPKTGRGRRPPRARHRSALRSRYCEGAVFATGGFAPSTRVPAGALPRLVPSVLRS